MPESKEFDVFVSHSSEDKREVVLPLVGALRQAGLRVWTDQQELTLGDSLRGKISDGLSRSRFGVVILSPTFLNKNWPKDELRALLSMEEDGRKRILPVRYHLTQVELAKQEPLIADRVSIACENNLDAVVDAILRVVQPSQLLSPGRFAVDLSHHQNEWNSFASFVENSELKLKKILRGFLEDPDVLRESSALILPPPFHVRLSQGEMDLLEAWVNNGGGLMIMGCYAERHHSSNFSQLAWRFDLDFGDDLIMPNDKSDSARIQVFSRDPQLSVRVVPASESHSILNGVHEIGFLSASSVSWCSGENPEFVIEAPSDSLKMRPLGHIQPDGSRPNIESWTIDRQGSAALFIARRWGQGKVVAVGSWKLCTLAYGDNAKFLANTLNWLAQR
jgi:hypothetical protein